MDRQLLRNELIRDEGLKLHVYRDSIMLYTIGVGHLLGTTPRMMDITEEEAMALLDMDIALAEGRVRSLFPFIAPNSSAPVEADEVRWRVLVNMSFNLGNRLMQFQNFHAAVVARDWETAGKEMLESKWAQQVGARATRLSQMIVTGRTP